MHSISACRLSDWIRIAFSVAVSIGSTGASVTLLLAPVAHGSNHPQDTVSHRRHCILGFRSHPDTAGPLETLTIARTQTAVQEALEGLDLSPLLPKYTDEVFARIKNLLTLFKTRVADRLARQGITPPRDSDLRSLLTPDEEADYQKIRAIEQDAKEAFNPKRVKGLMASSLTEIVERAAAEVVTKIFTDYHSMVEKTEVGPIGTKRSISRDQVLKARAEFESSIGLTRKELDLVEDRLKENPKNPLRQAFYRLATSSDGRWVIINWRKRFPRGPVETHPNLTQEHLQVFDEFLFEIFETNFALLNRSYRNSGLIENSVALKVRTLDDYNDSISAGFVQATVYAYDRNIFENLIGIADALGDVAANAPTDRRRTILGAIPHLARVLTPTASISLEFNPLIEKMRIARWFSNDLPDPLFLVKGDEVPAKPDYVPVPSHVTQNLAYLAVDSIANHSLYPFPIPIGLLVTSVEAFAHTKVHARYYNQLGLREVEKTSNPRWQANEVRRMQGTLADILKKLEHVTHVR